MLPLFLFKVVKSMEFNADAWYIWYYWDNFHQNYGMAEKGLGVLQDYVRYAEQSLYNQSNYSSALGLYNDLSSGGRYSLSPNQISFLDKCFREDQLLEEIYQNFAYKLNEFLSANTALGQYQQDYQWVQSHATMFKAGESLSNSQAKKFFDIIKRSIIAINSIQQKQIDLSPFDDLELVFTGKKSISEIAVYAESELKEVQEIYSLLHQLATNFGTSQQIIPELFGAILGEGIGAIALEQIPNLVLSATDDIVMKLPSSGIKVITTGADRTINSKKVSKVDISTGDAEIYQTKLTGNLTNNELKYLGSVTLNTSVKWHKVTGRNQVKIVSSSPLPQYLHQLDSRVQNYAYNFIALHDKKNIHLLNNSNNQGTTLRNTGYQETRKLVALSFVDNWLSGTGEMLQASGVIDKAQFMMINGKLYPMATIVRAICKSYDNKNGALRLNFQNIGRVENKFVKGETNIAKWERSRQVNNLINNIKVLAYLDLAKLGL